MSKKKIFFFHARNKKIEDRESFFWGDRQEKDLKKEKKKSFGSPDNIPPPALKQRAEAQRGRKGDS
jgi:hypothetical protein